MSSEDTTQTNKSHSNNDRLSHQKEWLLKVNGRILGPFSHSEVEQQLRDNHLVPHDEVTPPRGRWKLIRQEDRFREVINEIRNRQATKGESLSDTTFGGTITVTETSEFDDSFRNVSKIMKGFDHKSKNAKEETKEAPIESGQSRDLVKSYGSKSDIKTRKKLKRSENIKIAVALFIFILAGVFSVFRISNTSRDNGKSRLDSFSEAMNQGLAAEKVGDLVKAVSAYNEARNIKANDLEMLFHFAPLTFIYEKQSLQASRMFKQVFESSQNNEHKKASLMGLGLIALDSHELDVAMDNFSKVLTMESQNTQASFNIGIINYYKDKFEDAESYILKALDKGGNDGAVVLSMANVNIASSNNNGPTAHSRLIAAHKMMGAYLDVSQDYRHQVLIQDARVLAIEGRTNEATRNLESVLDLDPENPDSFLRDWQFYRGLAGWDQVLETLKKVLPSVNPSPHMTALLGYVMYQGRDKLDGAQNVEKALSQDPKDPLLMSLSGWMELKLGRKEAGTANIKEASLMNSNYKLPKILKARLCMEEKDFECAQKNWEALLKIDQRNLAAYYGLAYLSWVKKDTSSAVKWLRQGQAMDARYTPFLILNGEIEQAVNQGPQ